MDTNNKSKTNHVLIFIFFRIDNVLQFSPPFGVKSVIPSLKNDLLEQRVMLSYTKEDRRINLKIIGISVTPIQILGNSIPSNSPLIPPPLVGDLKLPFGACDLLFNDDDIRIIRTMQGYVSLNRRLHEEESVEKV